MRHIKSIEIKGFQSHADTTLTFHPGVNAITGPSDHGKSAILRAMRWCLWNQPPTGEWMRKGCTSASVAIIMSDNTAITRSRRNDRNRYEIRLPHADKLELADFGRDVPAEVLKAHGMIPVAFDPDKPSILNLATQLEAPFFLSDSATGRARTLGRLAGVHVIDFAITLVNRDIQAIARDNRTQETEIQRLETSLMDYANLEDQDNRVTCVERLLAKVQPMTERLAALQSASKRLAEIQSGLEGTMTTYLRVQYAPAAAERLAQAEMKQAEAAKLQHSRAVLAGLVLHLDSAYMQLKQLKTAQGAAEALTMAQEAHTRHSTLTRLQQALSTVQTGLSTTQAILNRTKGAEEAGMAIVRAQEARNQVINLGRLQGLLTTAQTGLTGAQITLTRTRGAEVAGHAITGAQEAQTKAINLVRLQGLLTTAQTGLTGAQITLRRTSGAEDAHQALGTLATVQDRHTLLSRHRGTLTDVTERLAKGATVMTRLTAEIETAGRNYAEALRDAGVCPTCLQTIDPETASRIAGTITEEECTHAA